jgi:Fic family protein
MSAPFKFMHDLDRWPNFFSSPKYYSNGLATLDINTELLRSKLSSIDIEYKNHIKGMSILDEISCSLKIEGITIDFDKLQLSLGQKFDILYIKRTKNEHSDRHADNLVDLFMDIDMNSSESLTRERLFAWHKLLFKEGEIIGLGRWREEEDGVMQVVSGPRDNPTVHFQAPDASRIPAEMDTFLAWFNSDNGQPAVIKAAIAHFWFVTIHPFVDGNGRMARAISSLAMASYDKISLYYSISKQILQVRAEYYYYLDKCQKSGDMDLTSWLNWFVQVAIRAVFNVQASIYPAI